MHVVKEDAVKKMSRRLSPRKKKKEKEADSTSGVAIGILAAKKHRESETYQSKTELSNAQPLKGAKYRVVLIEEGLGNLADAFYYTKEALKGAVALFEGKKIYANHPSRMEETDRPERSVRDILGHFENVVYKETGDGRGFLEADCHILESESFQWARDLMRQAVDYSLKYPDKSFIGLSINANGNAEPERAEDFLKRSDVPPSARPKIAEAIGMGVTEVRRVTEFTEAVSADLVTEAGAGGKVLQLLESDMRPSKMGSGYRIREAKKKSDHQEGQMGKKKHEAEAEEKKHESESESEAEAEKHEADDAGDGDGKKKAPPSDADDKKDGDDEHEEGEAEAEGEKDDPEHDDEDQDKKLIKDMLTKYLGDDEEQHSEENMKSAKEAYECYKEMGYDEKEAMHAAGHSMRLAKHMQKKESEAEAEAHHEASDKEVPKGSSKKPPIPPHKEADKKLIAENAKLKGELAAFREQNAKRELVQYIDKKLQESKLPMSVTKKLKEHAKNVKSKKDFDLHYDLFMEGYKSNSVAGEGALEGLFIQPEKTVTDDSTSSWSFSDCKRD